MHWLIYILAVCPMQPHQWRIQNLEKGAHMYKRMGFALLILSHYLKYPMRPNYFIFIGYLKTGGGGARRFVQPP